MNENLVSIIMPNYNTVKYIEESVLSVLNQTYKEFELIIVDDDSDDESVNLIKNMADSRIKLFCLNRNKGAANARNVAIENASGHYIAFMDSDDIWAPEKLDKQIKFMRNNDVSFLATYYDYVDFKGRNLNRVIKGKLVRNYWQLLKDCPGNSTIIYDAELLGKTYVPIIKRRNDYLMWLKVIKKAKLIYVIPEVLVHYRVREGSLSRNKINLIKYHWHIYRQYEKLNLLVSGYLIFYLMIRGIIRKINNLNI